MSNILHKCRKRLWICWKETPLLQELNIFVVSCESLFVFSSPRTACVSPNLCTFLDGKPQSPINVQVNSFLRQ